MPKYINRCASFCVRSKNLLLGARNKRVCIDLSCWMVQLQNVNKSHCPLKDKLYLKGLFHRLRALIALNCSLIFVTGTLISPSFAPLFFSSSFLVWTCVTKLYCLPDKNIYVFNFFLAISSGNFLWRILMQLGRSLSIVIFWYSVN